MLCLAAECDLGDGDSIVHAFMKETRGPVSNHTIKEIYTSSCQSGAVGVSLR